MRKIWILTIGLVVILGVALYMDGLQFFGLEPVHIVVIEVTK